MKGQQHSKEPIVWDVEQARALASWAHHGQVDKSGRAYLTHLAETFEEVWVQTRKGVAEDWLEEDKDTALMAAWLHDLPEDTEFDHKVLMYLHAPERLRTVLRLLDRGKWAPNDYYRVIKRDPIALLVKAADLKSNTHPARMRQLDEPTRIRLERKYARAFTSLGLTHPWLSPTPEGAPDGP